MKVIVVFLGDVMTCPPALSLVQVLNDLNLETNIISVNSNKDEILKSIDNSHNVSVKILKTNDGKLSPIEKIKRTKELKKSLENYITKNYTNDSVIWAVGEIAIKYLRDVLKGKRYILHFLELNEAIYKMPRERMFKINYVSLANDASVVLEAEYNRAHILQAWWNLKEVPMVFPNKPYNKINIEKNSEITSREDVKELMEKLKDKKIILYQGIPTNERPLDEYIKAVGELGDDYAFVMMTSGKKDPYPELTYDNYHCIPFIKPPFHLEVTSRAYIGILSYVPVHNEFSILNAVYCAPNKTWEYAKFGVPMISNDVPGLKITFSEYKCGETVEKLDKDLIKKAILTIENSYDLYQENAYKYYNSVDLHNRTKEILNKAFNKN